MPRIPLRRVHWCGKRHQRGAAQNDSRQAPPALPYSLISIRAKETVAEKADDGKHRGKEKHADDLALFERTCIVARMPDHGDEGDGTRHGRCSTRNQPADLEQIIARRGGKKRALW